MIQKAAERIGLVEETKLEPTFKEGISKVESYRLALDGALDGLELMIQPNRKVLETGAISSPPKQNPYELAASGCTKLKQFVNNRLENTGPIKRELQSRLDIIINAMNNMASTERAAQTKGRAAIRRIRRFVTVDNKEMKADVEKMNEGLLQMDVARHEVKNSKTKEELEEKGVLYQKTVRNFNEQASKIQLVIDELPSTIFTNQREVVKFFAQREKYHTTAAEILKEAVENLKKKQ
ncbi:unnamed protein product [Angiostrongylus costaricensis]|uniref:BAR domain-containing protein n=1 Tax=Angiostrongylus costaricensis TaxID=334426 RepID=A0A0R3PEY0_ANGCS|nr:unnamed protein product [Angiostrongylus costaricensis]